VYYLNYGDRRNWGWVGEYDFLTWEEDMWDFWVSLYDYDECDKIEEAFQTLLDEDHVYHTLMYGYVVALYERCTRFALRDYRLGMEIRNTSYCAKLPEVILGIIMSFIDWDDNVKFGYLSDAVRREVQVVLSVST
jgi:hypothetical protein